MAKVYNRPATFHVGPITPLLSPKRFPHPREPQASPARAIDYLEKAGQEAMQNHAYEEAERYLQESLEMSAKAAVLSEGYGREK